MMRIAAGTLLLGRFRVSAERGRPGGADVYDAVDEHSGEAASVVLLSGAAAGEDPERVLERASRYAVGCRGIARSLAAGLVGAAGGGASSRTRQVAVAYAAASGRSLEDLIRQDAHPAPEEIARLLSLVARALSPLHDQGVAHAYLRPELIALTEDGVSLQGFGAAQLAQSLGGPTLARDALPVAYRPPELRGAMPARAETWADVYALGVLATELVVGRAAPEHLDAPTPRALGLEVGDALESCIAEAVAVSVGTRPRDIELWALRLEAALMEPGALPAHAPPASTDADASAGAEAETAPPEHAEKPVAEEPEAAGTSSDEPAAAETSSDEPAAAEASSDEPGTGTAEQVETAPVAPVAPKPRSEPPHPPRPSKRSSAFAWPIVLAVVGGLMLMVTGVGALFWLALSTRPAKSPLATTSPATPHVGPVPWTAPPVASGPVTAPPLADGGVSSALPPPAPLPSGSALHTSAAADAALPVERDDPVWGKPDAPVTLLVFGDLDCPYTRRSLDVLQRLKTRFGDDLRLVWKNRPLDEHPHARDAAEVAVALEAAQGDEAFWKFASLAAASSQSSTPAHLSKWVSAAGGDGSRVSGWLADPHYSARVDRALELAGRYDIRATPTFFVNGLRVEGYQPFAALDRVIRRELSDARALITAGISAQDVYAERVRKNLIDLGPSAPVRHCPPVGSSPVRGASDALVTVVEYSDFQCPFCKRVEPTLDALGKRYGADLRIVWKNFPLEFHARARPAANFAMEALAQGGSTAFWRVHDALFAAQPSLDDVTLERIAREAGLNPAPLLDAADDATHKAAIDSDVREGQGFGVSGTPSFFVNGRELTGAQPLSKFESVVDDELAEAKRLVASGTARKDIYAAICGTH